MATMKRRVIYASDDEWAEWSERAKAENHTISAWLRERVILVDAVTYTEGELAVREARDYIPSFRPVPKPSQRQHR